MVEKRKKDYVSKAVARYIRISPYKCMMVADLIKGKLVNEALSTLAYLPQRSAAKLRKVMQSALSNAQQDASIDVDKLYVKNIFIDRGPVLKRWSTKARGRGTRILKPTSHITVVLDQRL